MRRDLLITGLSEEEEKKEMVNRVQWVQRAEEERKKEMMYIVQQVQRVDRRRRSAFGLES